MKTTETRDYLINQTFLFMRALVNEFGEEEGEKMWEKISETLPKGVRTQMLMMMITGAAMDRIVVSHAKMSAQKVPMIKALRELDSRGLGLKEAKELVDALTGTGYSEGKKGQTIEIHVKPEDRVSVINRLNAVGFVV